MNKDIVIIFSEKKDEIVVNLKDKINIQVANNPTGELNIVENGKYDVTNYATANVNIPISEEGLKATVEGTKLVLSKGTITNGTLRI